MFLFLFADAVAKKVDYFAATNTKNVQRFKGPGTHYPLMHVLTKRHYPFKVVGEFDHWCCVVCVDKEKGWIKKCHLSTKYRRSIVTKDTCLYAKKTDQSAVIAKLHKNVFLQIKSIQGDFAYVIVTDHYLKGWVRLRDIW